MPFDDLDEQLQNLGYGNQWQQHRIKLAAHKKVTDAAQLQRLNEYHRMYPQRHMAAINRWVKAKYQQRKQQVKHRVGKQFCTECNKKLNLKQLIWENAAPGLCAKCKKEKKKNESQTQGR